MNVRFNFTIGLLFILTGLLLSSPYILNCYKNTSKCSLFGANQTTAESGHVLASMVNTQSPGTITGLPVHISIPSVGIDTAIAPGSYDTTDNSWTIGTDKAYFATVTSQPNTVGGNTFIYGHNRSKLFQGLPNIQIGATATITTDNGHTFIYTFASKKDTDPYDVSLFEYQGKPVLTLQTCTGLWDEYRSLFTFNLAEAR